MCSFSHFNIPKVPKISVILCIQPGCSMIHSVSPLYLCEFSVCFDIGAVGVMCVRGNCGFSVTGALPAVSLDYALLHI
jgi:hypothetical protein